MDKRLQQFLELEDLTPSKLADILQIQRSGISHLLSGRNKPSFDFIEGILKNFPQINPDWLILGKGKPYRSQTSTPSPSPITTSTHTTLPTPINSPTTQTPSSPVTLFDTLPEQNQKSLFDLPKYVSETPIERPIEVISPQSALNDVQEEPPMTPAVAQQVTRISEPSQPSENRIIEPSSTTSQHISPTKRDKQIVRITVFYNDGTFEEK
ncbi:MAG: helix-turn-helix transcriptional regulator [Bacteroidales bacterium]|jgi:transcriptional regulator with XRE-family HTH domain|nr:helix-turn-helix transcriptional regulator [Bacteroidales bacterium]